MSGPGAAVIIYCAESDQDLDFFLSASEGTQSMMQPLIPEGSATFNPLQTSTYDSFNLGKTGGFNFTSNLNSTNMTGFSDSENQPLLGSIRSRNSQFDNSNDERALRNLRAM